MRRISRIRQPIGLFTQQSNARIISPYLCLACKLQTSSFSTSSPRTAPKVPYTEKIRQRIWGTDTPPGQQDPYGDASVFDRTKKDVPGHLENEVENRETEDQTEDTEVEHVQRKISKGSSRYQVVEQPEGLTLEGFLKLPAVPKWKPERGFKGFLPKRTAKDPQDITAVLRRALVEAFALKQAGIPLNSISSYATAASTDWTSSVEITPTPTGATINLSELSSMEDMIGYLKAQVAERQEQDEGEFEEEAEPTEPQEDITADRSEIDPLEFEGVDDSAATKIGGAAEVENLAVDQDAEVQRLSAEEKFKPSMVQKHSWDPVWLQITLQDPEIKFAVLKRTIQLTGIRPSDASISSANTARALLDHLITPPKPLTLAKAIQEKGDLAQHGNVTVHPRRVKMIEKERAIGRLKVINRELKKRGLEKLWATPKNRQSWNV